MTIVLNDASWWPVVDFMMNQGYVTVSILTVVVYDWGLTSGQEYELIWRQHWSFTTFLFVGTRYIGILYTLALMLDYVPISLTDTVSHVLSGVQLWPSLIINAMLRVIIIIRLYAMYQRSRKILIFLVVTCAAVFIVDLVYAIIETRGSTYLELILSGYHLCASQGDSTMALAVSWMFKLVWETLVLGLAVKIALKHMREVREASIGMAPGDCFTILIKTHIFYFTSFIFVSTFHLGMLAPQLSGNTVGIGSDIYEGVVIFAQIIQMLVLGPRLILSLREFYAKLVTNSDEGTAMTSIAFQERVHISTGDGV